MPLDTLSSPRCKTQIPKTAWAAVLLTSVLDVAGWILDIDTAFQNVFMGCLFLITAGVLGRTMRWYSGIIWAIVGIIRIWSGLN
jgi:hypothetical protein